jgi:hypothetical protein
MTDATILSGHTPYASSAAWLPTPWLQRSISLANRDSRRCRVELTGTYSPVSQSQEKLLETDKLVDIVAGPDAYRDLPNLITSVAGGAPEGGAVESGLQGMESRRRPGAMNVQLSADETYADIIPVRATCQCTCATVELRVCMLAELVGLMDRVGAYEGRALGVRVGDARLQQHVRILHRPLHAWS